VYTIQRARSPIVSLLTPSLLSLYSQNTGRYVTYYTARIYDSVSQAPNTWTTHFSLKVILLDFVLQRCTLYSKVFGGLGFIPTEPLKSAVDEFAFELIGLLK
jgi:hypothetical protein